MSYQPHWHSRQVIVIVKSDCLLCSVIEKKKTPNKYKINASSWKSQKLVLVKYKKNRRWTKLPQKFRALGYWEPKLTLVQSHWCKINKQTNTKKKQTA